MPEESQKSLQDSHQESRRHTKCSALIPDDLLERLKEAGYENRAEAIRLGLECLLKESQLSQYDSQKNQENLQKKPDESLKNLEESLKNLEESQKNQRESIGILKARNEELEKHNQSLNREIEQAHRDKETIQSLYDNYMRQMQTLIQQKAIEAPREKKKPWYKFW